MWVLRLRRLKNTEIPNESARHFAFRAVSGASRSEKSLGDPRIVVRSTIHLLQNSEENSQNPRLCRTPPRRGDSFLHCLLVLRRPFLGDRPSFPSPGGEGRVRGLFLGMGEGQNNEVKPAPGKRMDFRRSKCCKWRCIMRSAIYPSPNSPTNSFEEA